MFTKRVIDFSLVAYKSHLAVAFVSMVTVCDGHHMEVLPQALKNSPAKVMIVARCSMMNPFVVMVSSVYRRFYDKAIFMMVFSYFWAVVSSTLFGFLLRSPVGHKGLGRAGCWIGHQALEKPAVC